MRKVLLSLAILGACSVPLGVFVAVRAQNAPVKPIAKPDAKTNSNATRVERQTAAPWTGDPLAFEYPNREKTLHLPQTLRALNIAKGSRVADIGAGGGWLSTRLARTVGPNGIVYAQEILPRYVEFLKDRARKEKLPQMQAVLGTTTDPKLPADLDAVVILNAYHEFDQPILMLQRIVTSMKPGARLGFIERDNPALRREAEETYRKTGQIKRRVTEQPDQDPRTDDHRLALPIVEREAAEVGLKKVSARQLEDDLYLLVVEKPRG